MTASSPRQTIHGACLQVGSAGVLVLGPPGSGKSALALELIDTPGHALGGPLLKARLVADDQVVIRREGNTLHASPPEELAGLLEVRGLGVVHVKHLPATRLRMAVMLAPWREIERLPGLESYALLGLSLPLARIDPARPGAPARVRAALVHLGLA